MITTGLKIADCHCDTIALMKEENFDFGRLNSTGHIDLPRLRAGGVALQFFAVCVAPEKGRNHLQAALEQVSRYHRCLAENSGHIAGIECAGDLAAAQHGGKIAALLSLEGAEPLQGSPELLEIFMRLGVRALSLTWNHRNLYADGAGEEEAGGGLTRAGRKLVQELSGKGIILDLAHLSARCFSEALDLASRPPLVSHANARRLCDHPRNLTDEQLKALASRRGVIGLSFYPYFISGGAAASLEQLVDHFAHIAGLIGAEHVAFGSDFDGINCTVEGISDASDYPVLLEALCKRGFRRDDISLIAHDNVTGILRENLGGGTP